MPDDRKSWNNETEGRVARLLGDLARAESEGERAALATQLCELTGLDHGPRADRWLAWYLEDHLGMRNAVGILSGRSHPDAPAAAPDPLAEEVVFDRAEYNWCALERIKNKDDMTKLQLLYHDLESPLAVDAEGPLSFRRVAALENDDLGFFRGKSLRQALFDDGVQVRHLRMLKDYGKVMMMPLFPAPTQRAGAILYAASISAALVRHGVKVTSLSYKDLADSLPGLLERPYVVESFRALFQGALEKCS